MGTVSNLSINCTAPGHSNTYVGVSMYIHDHSIMEFQSYLFVALVIFRTLHLIESSDLDFG